jgi:hypothetical protein
LWMYNQLNPPVRFHHIYLVFLSVSSVFSLISIF